jgi:hypothetical protein
MKRPHLTVVAGTDSDASMARFMAVNPETREKLGVLVPTLRQAIAEAGEVLAVTDDETSAEYDLQALDSDLRSALDYAEQILSPDYSSAD